jgi:hypothetical protein
MRHDGILDTRWVAAAALVLAAHAAGWHALQQALQRQAEAHVSTSQASPRRLAWVELRESIRSSMQSELGMPTESAIKPVPEPLLKPSPPPKRAPRVQGKAFHPSSTAAMPPPVPDAVEAPAHPGALLPLLQAHPPAAQRLHFEVTKLQTNAVHSEGASAQTPPGEATLEWSYEAADRYRIHFVSAGEGAANHRWVSEGTVDAQHGFKPERMAARSKGRSAAVVNFEHAGQRAWFSGPRPEQALAQGAQDRLSWLVQLPAVLSADPKLREVGAEVAMQVLGPRGEASVWRFTVLGPQRLGLDASVVVDTLVLERLGEHLHDTDVKVWLDAAPPHLPWRWQWHLRVLRAPPTVWTRRVMNPTNP